MLDPDARTIDLVFKTHFDIAFIDHASRVHEQRYEASSRRRLTSASIFFRKGPERPIFIWTTGAWLIWDYLETRPAAGVAPAATPHIATPAPETEPRRWKTTPP